MPEGMQLAAAASAFTDVTGREELCARPLAAGCGGGRHAVDVCVCPRVPHHALCLPSSGS